MKMYKTSHFRDITEVEVVNFSDRNIFIMASVIYPRNPRYIKEDKVIAIERYGSQNSYHKTKIEAKNFVLMQLSDKIRKIELDLKKYKNLVSRFQ